MNSPFPTHFQRKVCWSGLTALAGLIFVGIMIGVGWILLQAIHLFQPVLVPIIIASILAYLLNPLVTWLCRYHLPRTTSVILVFAMFSLFLMGIIFWITPSLQRQGSSFIKNLPAYHQHIQSFLGTSAEIVSHFMESTSSRSDQLPITQLDKIHDYAIGLLGKGINWMQEKIPMLIETLGHVVQSSIGSVVGIVGMMISLVLVPILLFFFLLESEAIKEHWSDYLPLPPSALKEEVVALLLEINNTIIFFFRGQLLVTLIDGAMIAISLMFFVHLDFAPLIGLMVCILGLIPYAGIIICWIPALLIAVAQFGDWWHPLLVSVIFLVANNLDSIVISPRIVGKSVGLHPVIVILSVFTWSILLGGLLGALLAVPLTASLFVILRRYVWDSRESRVECSQTLSNKVV